MTLVGHPGSGRPRPPVAVELDDIQAAVLRYRPEPYYGTHVMLHMADAQAGREFLRRVTPHVGSAAGWWQAGRSWISVAISYAGLAALGVPQDSLDRPTGAARLAHAADEPARHQAGHPHRREHSPRHQAQHHLRGPLRSGRDFT
ncbi:MAG TPA: hypothetical protein VMK84_15360, partial [Streptosporangiaceae bacterium]|nr:hypothetical protein [Streptosporangiaceae bacterium]